MIKCRVEQAIKALERVKQEIPQKFSLCTWAMLRFDEQRDLNKELSLTKKSIPIRINGCGTTACALGHIASDPYAIERGLTLMVLAAPFGDIAPQYKNEIGFGAGMGYLGIEKLTAELLFDPDEYEDEKDWRKPQAVIDRLQLLLDVGEDSFQEMLYD